MQILWSFGLKLTKIFCRFQWPQNLLYTILLRGELIKKIPKGSVDQLWKFLTDNHSYFLWRKVTTPNKNWFNFSSLWLSMKTKSRAFVKMANGVLSLLNRSNKINFWIFFLDFYGGETVLKNFDQTFFSLQPFKGRLLIFTQSNESSQSCNTFYDNEIKRGIRYDLHVSFTLQKPNGNDFF